MFNFDTQRSRASNEGGIAKVKKGEKMRFIKSLAVLAMGVVLLSGFFAKEGYTQSTNRPDLVPRCRQIQPSQLRVGQQATITVLVQNMGAAAAGQFKVNFYDNGAQFASVLLAGLGPGASTPLTVSWTPTRVGLHMVYVFADATSLVVEMSESNNRCIFRRTVR